MTSFGVGHSPILRLSSIDEIQVRRALRRNRILATGLLVLMVVIAAGTRLYPSQGWVIQLVRAGAEAGIVGGLADWFAITVLFRHPFGIPIPHTAILPRNKDRIGRSLGAFVERNFLVPETILPKLHKADLTANIAAWLVRPENAAMAADQIITLLKRLPATGDREQNEFIQRAVGEQLRRLDLAPLLARVVDVLTSSEESDILFERLARAAENWIAANRTRIDEMVGQNSHWWIPRTIDRRIATKVVDSTIDLMHHLRQRDSEVRTQFRAAVTKLTDDLMTSSEQSEKIQRLKNSLFDDAEVRTWIASAWSGFSERLMQDLSDPRSNIGSTLQSKLVALGHSMRDDASLRALVDSLIERLVSLLISFRSEIGSWIAEVVGSWDSHTVSDRLELVLGSDLQYIRINGTMVGALVGCAIYLLSTDVIRFEPLLRDWFR